jgi:acyl-CoA dehydrogenase
LIKKDIILELTIWLIFTLSVCWFMLYSRVKLSSFTLVFALLLLLASTFQLVSIISWLLFIAIATPLNLIEFRKQHISQPLLAAFQKIMPQMSRTEKEALDAGTTWWDADLFHGEPDWEKLHNFPKPRLTADEQAFLDGEVEQVCKMMNDWQATHELADLPAEVWQYLKDNKFFAMIIKKQYGGLQFSAYAQSRVLQKLTSVSSMLSSTVGVPNSLGPGELLQHYGTDAQKNHYLPRLATGEEIPCFALTSPEAGSDAGAIPDFGIICQGEFDGETVLGMKLTWDKRYITLAPIATVLGLAFKLYDPEHLLGEQEDIGITCALIPTNLPGVIYGRRHFPLNVPFQNGPTQGNEVFVPLDFIIGGPKMAGHGWRMLVECLSVGRSITLPSTSAGGIKSIALATGAYARIRRQFKMPIGKMEGIEEPLARIGGNAYLMDAVTTLSTGAIDLGEKPSVIGAISKYHLTEKMRLCVNDAMDIHGGKGICMGPNNYLARGYQGAPVAITVEGANILTRNMIIYGQGAIRCHPYVLAELDAANNPDTKQALKEFDHALFGHLGFTLSNMMRSLWFSITAALLVKSPRKDQTARYYQKITRFSSNLAMLSDIAMAVLGGDLKRRERISARLGDLLSYLYLASAALKRFEDQGRQSEDLPLVQWAVEDSLSKAALAIEALINNFPNKAIAYLLRALVMPFGKAAKPPSDQLDHKVARLLQIPSDSRSRLGQGQYLTRDKENILGQLEQCLENILACEPIFDRVCKALGEKRPFMALDKIAEQGLKLKLISEQEAQLLKSTEVYRQQVIAVDDFESDYLAAAKQ